MLNVEKCSKWGFVVPKYATCATRSKVAAKNRLDWTHGFDTQRSLRPYIATKQSIEYGNEPKQGHI